MDSAPLVRLRWRLRGAWLWPSFVVLSLADAVIIHDLPPQGDGANIVGAWLLGSVLSLLGIVLFSSVLGRLVRRFRPDMPRVVARNYAGAVIALSVTLAFLAGGLVHRQTIESDNAALREAAMRAQTYIGAHAPAPFRENMRLLVTYQVQPPVFYRSCVPDLAGSRHYCVIVDLRKPFGHGVYYSGSESNSLLSQGTG